MSTGAVGDEVDPETVSVSRDPDVGEPVELLRPGRQFAAGASGWLRTRRRRQRRAAVYVEPGRTLRAATSTRCTSRAVALPARA